MSRLRNDDFIPLPTAINLKPLELPDCIYLSTRCRCDILCVRECIGETCAFLKTERQRRESCRKWRRALSTLSGDRQQKIAAKYYSGKFLWKPQERRWE